MKIALGTNQIEGEKSAFNWINFVISSCYEVKRRLVVRCAREEKEFF